MARKNARQRRAARRNEEFAVFWAERALEPKDSAGAPIHEVLAAMGADPDTWYKSGYVCGSS